MGRRARRGNKVLPPLPGGRCDAPGFPDAPGPVQPPWPPTCAAPFWRAGPRPVRHPSTSPCTGEYPRRGKPTNGKFRGDRPTDWSGGPLPEQAARPPPRDKDGGATTAPNTPNGPPEAPAPEKT